jgi:diguanylate cyclase (GGDEF)-like protein
MKRIEPTALTYALLGVALGAGAPAGLLALRFLVSGVGPVQDVAEHAFFYLYALLATSLAFGVAGLAVGRRYEVLKRRSDRWKTLSNLDPLTSLANARAFEGHYRRIVHENGAPENVSLLLADVDDLKGINDRHGHAAGSAVLRRVAAALLRCKRVGDVAARWGGDEFTVLLPGAASEAALRLAAAIREDLRCSPAMHGGRPVPATVTIGTATRGAGSRADLFALADAALYEGKRAGRDRIVEGRSR